MEDLVKLKRELDVKIQNLFKDNQSYLDYLLQTKSNFLYRYLETSSDKNLPIVNATPGTLKAQSFESNMGDAFKIQDPAIKEGIKSLAKTVPREEKPKIQYSLTTVIEDISGNAGKIVIISQVNWDFPEFNEHSKNAKSKKIIFEYSDPNIFRKELALKYEEACELFL